MYSLNANKFPRALLGLSICLLLVSCGGSGGSSQTTTSSPPANLSPPPPEAAPQGPIVEMASSPASSSQLAAGGCQQSNSDTGKAFIDVSLAAGFCYAVAKSPEDSIPARVGGGVAVADFDQDGMLDVYVSHGRDSKGKLLRLNSDFSFEDVTQDSGIVLNSTDHAANFIDLDEDGDQDFISIQEDAPYIEFFANQGESKFTNITHLVDIEFSKIAHSMAAGDIDLDGDLDLFFSHWHPDNKQTAKEFLWQNLGQGAYQDITDTVDLEPFNRANAAEEDEEYSFTPIFADTNDDSYPDLLLAADWSTSQFLTNNAGAGFVDQTLTAVVTDRAGMGAAVADYDNDGDLDWFVSAIGDTREEFLTIGLFNGNRLYQNDGQGNFLNMTDFADVRQGYWAWGSCFADVNNDGYEDLFVVNGYNGWTEEQAQSGSFDRFETTPALMYINQQDGTFVEQAAELGIEHTGMGRGLACYDYDRDGDVDLLIANNGASPTLYRNDSDATTKHFINVRLKGLKENPQAVGARIYVKTSNTNQMRELQLGNHYVSQNPVEAHFGLAGSVTIEEIRIKWPGTTAEDSVLTDIPVDNFILVHHPDLDDE